MGMDRKIERKKWTTKKIAGIAAIALVVSFILYGFLFADKRSKLNVDREKITIATVREDNFQENIAVSGTVQPIRTVYMDAVEGGIIKKLHRESGAMVKPGDTILTLTNSNLELNVMNQRANLYEQLNNLRNTRLLLEQNSFNLRDQLAQIDYQIQLWKPQYERFQQLFDKKMISKREFEEVAEQYKYNVERKKIVYASYRQDSIARQLQNYQINQQEDRMQNSLEAVEHVLDNLIVRAPSQGQLAMPDLQIGQSITTGERLGQVDIIDNFKVRVRIDELYLPRINTGQQGTFSFAGDSYRLEITKIYPTIAEGRFEVDMEFIGDQPQGIKRGQTVRLRLALSNEKQAVLLPIGGFYKDTGGNWVYVLNDDGNAEKRNIRLGQKNTENFEVLEGLQPGERVITSSYENFGDKEVLVLK
ncbi:HlyD family secretion protein [Catalinimonas alkaloidigena]|uniref:HlyD family secretion protein n=2 Tax=Catalinimonas alkaloidigena TaxID=1075417 RepID=A0A1G9BFM3_9BACT|nr:HlyD family secretion protein [Catalinimonas alkaloidigena]